MTNAWITADGSAATRALNQEIGDVHAPSLHERRTPNAVGESATTQRPAVHPRDFEGVAPSLVVHHEHTNVVSPSDLSGSAHRSFSRRFRHYDHPCCLRHPGSPRDGTALSNLLRPKRCRTTSQQSGWQ